MPQPSTSRSQSSLKSRYLTICPHKNNHALLLINFIIGSSLVKILRLWCSSNFGPPIFMILLILSLKKRGRWESGGRIDFQFVVHNTQSFLSLCSSIFLSYTGYSKWVEHGDRALPLQYKALEWTPHTNTGTHASIHKTLHIYSWKHYLKDVFHVC